MSQDYYAATGRVMLKNGKKIELYYEYENEIRPELVAPLDFFNSSNIFDLICKSFIDSYEDDEDREIRQSLDETVCDFEGDEKFDKFKNKIKKTKFSDIKYIFLGVAAESPAYDQEALVWVKYNFDTKTYTQGRESDAEFRAGGYSYYDYTDWIEKLIKKMCGDSDF